MIILFFFTVCCLIEKLSLSKLPLKNDPVLSEIYVLF